MGAARWMTPPLHSQEGNGPAAARTSGAPARRLGRRHEPVQAHRPAAPARLRALHRVSQLGRTGAARGAQLLGQLQARQGGGVYRSGKEPRVSAPQPPWHAWPLLLCSAGGREQEPQAAASSAPRAAPRRPAQPGPRPGRAVRPAPPPPGTRRAARQSAPQPPPVQGVDSIGVGECSESSARTFHPKCRPLAAHPGVAVYGKQASKQRNKRAKADLQAAKHATT